MKQTRSPLPPQGSRFSRIVAGGVYAIGFYVVALAVAVIVVGWFAH